MFSQWPLYALSVIRSQLYVLLVRQKVAGSVVILKCVRVHLKL